jgi:hypothetical protein
MKSKQSEYMKMHCQSRTFLIAVINHVGLQMESPQYSHRWVLKKLLRQELYKHVEGCGGKPMPQHWNIVWVPASE